MLELIQTIALLCQLHGASVPIQQDYQTMKMLDLMEARQLQCQAEYLRCTEIGNSLDACIEDRARDKTLGPYK